MMFAYCYGRLLTFCCLHVNYMWFNLAIEYVRKELQIINILTLVRIEYCKLEDLWIMTGVKSVQRLV